MAQYYLSAFADEAGIEFDTQIAALQRNRIRFMEIRGTEYGPIDTLANSTVKELRKKLDDGGIAISSVGSRLGKSPITGKFSHSLETLKRLLEICEMLSARQIRMFSYYMPEGEENIGVYREEVMERLNLLCDCAEKAGVRLMHENEAAIYGEKTAEVLQIHQDVPRLGGIFDPSNYRKAGVDQAATVKSVMPYVDYLHIKDCTNDGVIVPAGYGDGLIAEAIEEHSRLYSGNSFLVLEPHLKKFQGYGDIDKSELKLRFSFKDQTESFDFAVKSLKEVLTKIGYRESEDLAWKK